MEGVQGQGQEDGEGGAGGAAGQSGKVERTGSSMSTTKAAEVDEEVFTDADGWVYGDNKWEHGSSKGGMGKVRLFLIAANFLPICI